MQNCSSHRRNEDAEIGCGMQNVKSVTSVDVRNAELYIEQSDAESGTWKAVRNVRLKKVRHRYKNGKFACRCAKLG